MRWHRKRLRVCAVTHARAEAERRRKPAGASLAPTCSAATESDAVKITPNDMLSLRVRPLLRPSAGRMCAQPVVHGGGGVRRSGHERLRRWQLRQQVQRVGVVACGLQDGQHAAQTALAHQHPPAAMRPLVMKVPTTPNNTRVVKLRKKSLRLTVNPA